MLHQSNFKNIGILAKHCDLEKLEIAESHALQFDVSQLYCDNWMDILTIWQEIEAYNPEVDPEPPTNYVLKNNLINGGAYTTCNGKTATHQGVIDVAAYYTYARYILLNSSNDTATGVVTKTNEYSIPKTRKELESDSDMYRNMGRISFENTVKFLCANKDVFTFFTTCQYTCGCCATNDCGGTKATGYGLRSTNILKR